MHKFTAFFLVISSSVLCSTANAEPPFSQDQWEQMYVQTNKKDWNGDLTLQDYDELVNRCPDTVSRHHLAMCYYKLARKLDDMHARKDYLLKAKNLVAMSDEKTAQLTDVFRELVWTCLQLKENDEAEKYAKLGVSYAELVYGKRLRSAIALVDYASAAALNKEFELSEKIIKQIDEMRKNATIEERRDYETELLFQLGHSCDERKDYENAEKYYIEAIAAGETLWYPLYSWCKLSFSRLIGAYNAQGKFKESHRFFLRAMEIEDTGLDPAGKNMCKYWNGTKAPECWMPHVHFTTYKMVSGKQLHEHPPKAWKPNASDKDPLVVYKKFKRKIDKKKS